MPGAWADARAGAQRVVTSSHLPAGTSRDRPELPPKARHVESVQVPGKHLHHNVLRIQLLEAAEQAGFAAAAEPRGSAVLWAPRQHRAEHPALQGHRPGHGTRRTDTALCSPTAPRTAAPPRPGSAVVRERG